MNKGNLKPLILIFFFISLVVVEGATKSKHGKEHHIKRNGKKENEKATSKNKAGMLLYLSKEIYFLILDFKVCIFQFSRYWNFLLSLSPTHKTRLFINYCLVDI